MRYLFFIIIISVSFIACRNNNIKTPIEREKLIKILVEVHLAEAAMQELSLEQSKRDSIGKLYYKKVFETNKVTEADFNKTMFLLRQNPEKLETLYKKVIADLEKREEAARNQK